MTIVTGVDIGEGKSKMLLLSLAHELRNCLPVETCVTNENFQKVGLFQLKNRNVIEEN